METIRKVISKSSKRKIGAGKAGSFTQMVVIHTPIGKNKGRILYKSQTRHELVS
jgi:hypothetical protein